MGRKRHFERPALQPAQPDQALLGAVREALAALSASRKETTPSAIEEWIKTNQYAVWSSITSASALKGAIEAAKREEPTERPRITPKGARGMGRKKKDAPREGPPEPPPKREPASAGNGSRQDPLAEVVRKALHGVGVEADNEAVQGWITRNYPGRGFNLSTLNTTISAQRSKLKRQAAEAARPVATTTPRLARAGDYDPTRSELLRVLAIARQESSVSKLQKLVATVKQLADQVGGLDRLAVCLDTLEEFGIK
jgi:hypothetical protein